LTQIGPPVRAEGSLKKNGNEEFWKVVKIVEIHPRAMPPIHLIATKMEWDCAIMNKVNHTNFQINPFIGRRPSLDVMKTWTSPLKATSSITTCLAGSYPTATFSVKCAICISELIFAFDVFRVARLLYVLL
jgi:hypothetical protein